MLFTDIINAYIIAAADAPCDYFIFTDTPSSRARIPSLSQGPPY